MKFIDKKNPSTKLRASKGFALLFSVLVSSLLLTIGLSIFSIALKELSISTASRQSIHAFYAADSGRECINYWDKQRRYIADYYFDAGEITCGDFIVQTPDNDKQSNQTFGLISTQVPNSADLDGFVYVSGTDGPNFRVEVTKYRNVESDPIITTINSIGYDSPSGDRVERAIIQTY